MTRREQEARKRRRERREALARAELEFAVGGALEDLHRPVIGGGDAEHPLLVQAEMERRILMASREVMLIAVYFADRCWVRAEEARRMKDELTALLMTVGPMKVPTTHSTRPGVAPTTIPMTGTEVGT